MLAVRLLPTGCPCPPKVRNNRTFSTQRKTAPSRGGSLAIMTRLGTLPSARVTGTVTDIIPQSKQPGCPDCSPERTLPSEVTAIIPQTTNPPVTAGGMPVLLAQGGLSYPEIASLRFRQLLSHMVSESIAAGGSFTPYCR